VRSGFTSSVPGSPQAAAIVISTMTVILALGSVARDEEEAAAVAGEAKSTQRIGWAPVTGQF